MKAGHRGKAYISFIARGNGELSSLPFSRLDFLLHWSRQWLILVEQQPQMRERVLPLVFSPFLPPLPPSHRETLPRSKCGQLSQPNLNQVFNIFGTRFSVNLFSRYHTGSPCMVPIMVEAEPMGGTAPIYSPFLTSENFAKNRACNLPRNLSSCMNSSSSIASSPL